MNFNNVLVIHLRFTPKTLHESILTIFKGNDEYICKAAGNADNAKTLIEVGFEYVCTTPDGIMLFRKRK